MFRLPIALLALFLELVSCLDWSQARDVVTPLRHDIRADNPNITDLTPQFYTDLGSKRVRAQYGPYTAPSTSENGGMKTFLERKATMPCTDCLITFMQADLAYPNGTYANSNTGMWLHHTVLFNTHRQDLVGSQTCASTKLNPNRFFASGNERTPVDLTNNGTFKAGYYVGSNDSMSGLIELMNETEDPRDAVMTVDYEYIPGMPEGFTQVQTWWLDVNMCNGSEVPGQLNATFDYTMDPPYTTNTTGHILGVAGHIHDGGLVLDVLKNGESICNSTATYGAAPGYIDMMANMTDMSGMDMDGMNMSMGMDTVHISNISRCVWPSDYKTGDKFSVKAYYNTTEHPAMEDGMGGAEPVMGIGVAYVVEGDNFSNLTTNGQTPTATTMGVATSTATGSSSSSSGGSGSGQISAGNDLISSSVIYSVVLLTVFTGALLL